MLPDCMIYKILSYAEGNPQIYLNTALCCKKFRVIATSDHAWQRFNVFNVQEVYKHFLAERSKFKRVEKLFYDFIDIFTMPPNLKIDLLNPYTQLVILLKRDLFHEFYNQVTNGRVMELGVLEPGNLLFYACPKLRANRDLARLSLRSRQHPGITMPPVEWDKDLQLDWHFAYANIDSEVHAPYTSDFYSMDPRKGRKNVESWSPAILLDLSLLDKNNRNHMGYMLCAEGDYIKMGDQYFCIDDDEHFERTETDPAYCQAALDSGCPIFCFKNPSHETQIKALQRGGARDVFESELPWEEILDHNPWGLYTDCYADTNSSYGCPFEKLVKIVRKNAHIWSSVELTKCKEQRKQVLEAEKSAKQNGRYLRCESSKYCQIEWFAQRPLYRRFEGRPRSAAIGPFFEGEFVDLGQSVESNYQHHYGSPLWWTILGRPFILFWPWQHEVDEWALSRPKYHAVGHINVARSRLVKFIDGPRYHFILGTQLIRRLDESLKAFPDSQSARDFFVSERATSDASYCRFRELLFTKPQDIRRDQLSMEWAQSYMFMFLIGISQHRKANRRFSNLFGLISNEYLGKAIVLLTGEPRYLDLTLATFQTRDFWDPILEKHPECYRLLSPKLRKDLLGAM